MTDEGQQGDPMSEVELMHLVRNLAMMNWVLFKALQEQGFTEGQALKLCAAQIHGAAGGKLEGP